VLVARGLWYSVFGSRAIQVVLARDPDDTDGYQIALVSTDVGATPAQLLARYGERWSIRSASRTPSTSSASARPATAPAARSSAPCRSGSFARPSPSAWYALHGDIAADIAARRRVAPWYAGKHDPSALDMLASLRHELIRTQFRAQAPRRRKHNQFTRPALSHAQAAA
jgi:hypothetical protein